MLLTFLLTLSAQAACFDVVPYKQLGKLKIGAELPAGFRETRGPDFSADSIRQGEGYKFDTDDQSKVNFILRDLQPKECFHILGKRLRADTSTQEIKKLFPNCEFGAAEGGNQFQCDGFLIRAGNLNGKKVGIAVSRHDIASVKAERIERNSRQILQQEAKKYPWIKK